jgi:hypothetical protein
VIECLLCKHKPLSSNARPTKNKQKKNKKFLASVDVRGAVAEGGEVKNKKTEFKQPE